MTGWASDDAVLHQHLRHVRIGAHGEGHRQRVGPVVGTLARHVNHALDATDLLLDWRPTVSRSVSALAPG